MIFAIPLSFFVGAVFCILANKKITAKKIAITFALINFALCFQGNFVNNLLAKGSFGLGGWTPPYGIEFFAEPIGLTFVCLVSMIGFYGFLYSFREGLENAENDASIANIGVNTADHSIC